MSWLEVIEKNLPTVSLAIPLLAAMGAGVVRVWNGTRRMVGGWVRAAAVRHLKLGTALLKCGECRLANEQFDLAAKKAKRIGDWALLSKAVNGRGVAQARLGNTEGAAGSFLQALAIDPGLDVARQNLQRVRSWAAV